MKKIIFILLTSLFIVSCATAPITGRKQLKFVSDRELSEAYSTQYREMIETYRSKGMLANNTVDGRRLANIGNNIANVVETYMRLNGMSNQLNNYDWEFNLIKSDEINAFALPGGKIAFYTGILPILETDAAIAYIMGHEIGHVIGGHHAEGSSQRQLAGITSLIGGLFLGDLGGALIGDVANLTLLKFNRTQEYEADQYGMIFMAMAGYDPRIAIDVQRKIAETTGSANRGDFFSTHPSGRNRIKEMEKFLPEALTYYNRR